MTQLLGNINYHDYQEGWLISTGSLGKDAKGFKSKWEEKSVKEYSKIKPLHS